MMTVDGIYVVDAAPENPRKGFWNMLLSRKRKMTTEQYAEHQRMIARTLVPLADYKGGYHDPVVLIERDLDFPEIVEVIPIN